MIRSINAHTTNMKIPDERRLARAHSSLVLDRESERMHFRRCNTFLLIHYVCSSVTNIAKDTSFLPCLSRLKNKSALKGRLQETVSHNGR